MRMVCRLDVGCHGRHERRSLNVLRIAHGKEHHDLSAPIERIVDRLGVLALHVPLSPHSGDRTIPIGRRPRNEEGGILRFENGGWFSSARHSSLIIIHRRGLLIPEHVVRQFLLAVGFRRRSSRSRLGKFAQFALPVRKVTSVPERTIPAQKVLAQANLVKFVGLGRRPPHRRHAVLPRLHLTQPQREIRHHGQVAPIAPHVPIPTERAVDAKPLAVKHALQPIGLADVPERTVLHLAPIPVTT
mmetsp:Transcript_21836/g.37471  ORF Transcript_21836/g.37471 Transcript_21836/m.37471 type:complete len:244 (-) Transcript_21836:171-902(-)